MKTAVVLRELSHRRGCRINNEEALVSAGKGNGAGKLWSSSTHGEEREYKEKTFLRCESKRLMLNIWSPMTWVFQ
ncbi:hypothetical protein TNIN_113081 [Trichonephila inaurata madagascariensis]|uniref:Uncharacterized protein n=1 Tax=Trichonephila inaurata madagascariensis TaxID=2747483 RepID=A0A8X6MLC9_9ARAC|nr:hypothetical protein TNIN_113081 [Trichonephila inaurata madagascariensis]